MRALTVQPGKAGTAQVDDLPEPAPGEEELLVDGLALGVCGTDREIVAGAYGWAPPGQDRLVLGHESLGRVRQAPPGSGFVPGDLVVGVVRRPDPLPCGACAHGEFDMCRNGRYTERGIKQIDGYGRERGRWRPTYAVKLDPRLAHVGVLLEPTTVVAKAWEQIERIGARAWFEPQPGAGHRSGPDRPAGRPARRPARARCARPRPGHRRPEAGPPSPRSAPPTTTARSRTWPAGCKPDVVIEATGAGQLVFDAIANTAPYGIICLTGVSTGRPPAHDRRRRCEPARSCWRTTSSSARSTPTSATTAPPPMRSPAPTSTGCSG